MPERYVEFYSQDESRPTIRTLDAYYINNETGRGFISFEGTYNTDCLVFPHRLCFKTILCEDEPYRVVKNKDGGVTYIYKHVESSTYEVEVYNYDKEGRLYTIYFRPV